MTQTLLVARREIVDRKNVFIAAVVVSLLTLLLPFLHFNPISRAQLTDAMAVLSAMVAFLFAVAIAMMCGATMIGRDLSERRLGFYLARPLSAASIWFGKLFGTMVVVFVSAALIVIPSMTFNRFQMPRSWSLDEMAVAAPLILVATVLIAHLLSTLIRSRSAWIAVDLSVLGIFGFTFWSALEKFFTALSIDVAMRIIGIAGGVIFVALMVSGVVQIAAGRADVRRSHRALSIFMLSVIVVVTLATVAFAVWFFNPDIDDLREIHQVKQIPHSSWAVVGGNAKGRGRMYAPTFLYDTASGRAIHLGTASAHFRPTVSADGSKVIAWGMSGSAGWRAAEGLVVDLEQLTEKPTRLVLPNTLNGTASFLSSDGRYLLSLGEDNLGVFSTGDGTSLMSAAAHAKKAVFISPTVARIFEPRANALEIRELDVTRKTVRAIGTIPGSWDHVNPNANATRVIVKTAPKVGNDARLQSTLVDGGSGDVIAPLGPIHAQFLPDDRIIGIGQGELLLFDQNGAPVKRLAMKGQNAYPVATSRDGKSLYLIVKNANDNWKKGSTLVVSLDSFTVTGTLGDLRPAADSWSTLGAVDLFGDSDGGVVRIDPRTGERKQLLAPAR